MLRVPKVRVVAGKAEFIYSGFYDVPLAFVVWHGRRQFLFLREFDDALDNYPDTYRVFSLPGLSDEIIKSSWQRIESLATAFLGEVFVREVNFDPSRRKEMETSVID
jgi:hypothetical protein